MLCNEVNKNWIGSYAVSELSQQQSVMGASIFRSPTHCFQVCWADQLSSLWVVDSCPNFAEYIGSAHSKVKGVALSMVLSLI